MKESLKTFWAIHTTSFSVLIVIFALLEQEITRYLVLHCFLLCAIIAAFQVAWIEVDKRMTISGLPFFIIDGMIRGICTAVIASVYGMIVGFWDWAWRTFLDCLVTVLPVFIVTYTINAIAGLCEMKRQTDDINKKIDRR